MGPGCVLAGDRPAELVVGDRSAFCRRHCGSLRVAAGAVGRRDSVRARTDANGACADARHAATLRRRAAGVRARGMLFNVVLAAFGKLLPERWRALAFGGGTAAGSFGQFLFSPLAVVLKDAYGWHNALMIFAALCLLMLPLSLALATARNEPRPGSPMPQSLKQALSEAVGHRSYILVVLGFFTCGFQLAFITVHLPAYLVDKGLSAAVGGWTIAVIGLFNIVGSLSSGWLAGRVPKRYILSVIYTIRALAVLAFIAFPVTAASAIAFGAVMGLMWLSTVPPTNALIA